MEINDPRGMYKLIIDNQQRIVYEKNIGLWSSEDCERFFNDYAHVVINILGTDKPWLKLCDLREYELSRIFIFLIQYRKWLLENNLSCAAILTNDPIVKMQVHEVAKSHIPHKFFEGLNAFDDAQTWLESKK